MKRLKKGKKLTFRVAYYLADIRTSDRRNTGLVLCRCTEPFRELFLLRSTLVFTFHLRLDFPSVFLVWLSDQHFVFSTLVSSPLVLQPEKDLPLGLHNPDSNGQHLCSSEYGN